MKRKRVVIEEPKPVRVRTSSFHITINTNQRYTNKMAIMADMRPFWDAIQSVYGTKDDVMKFIEILNEGDSFEGHVGHVESETSIEYAQSGLHMHTMLTLVHATKLRIDIPKLKNLFLEQLPHLKNLYLHVRYVRNETSAVRNYIHKNAGDSVFRMLEGTTFNVGADCECKCKKSISDMSTWF